MMFLLKAKTLAGRVRTYLHPSFFVKPRRRIGVVEASRLLGGKWTVVYPSQRITRLAPKRIGRESLDLIGELDTVFPDFGVAALPGASVFTEHGWVFTPDRRVVPDLTWYAQHEKELQIFRKLPTIRPVKGTCVSICSDFSPNPAHYLLDCLSRLHLLEQAGISLKDVDHIFCPVANNNTRSLMAQLGVPMEKCIWADDRTAIRPDVLIVTSYPGLRRNYPRWLPEFFRSKLSPPASVPEKRLYVARIGNVRRKISNGDRIRAIARERGFEIYDPTGKQHQHEVFASATVIVSAHSASLANLVFSHPSARVLELIPSDHVHPYYYTLAESAGMDYAYLAGHSEKIRRRGETGPSPYDFSLDATEFSQALDDRLQ